MTCSIFWLHLSRRVEKFHQKWCRCERGICLVVTCHSWSNASSIIAWWCWLRCNTAKSNGMIPTSLKQIEFVIITYLLRSLFAGAAFAKVENRSGLELEPIYCLMGRLLLYYDILDTIDLGSCTPPKFGRLSSWNPSIWPPMTTTKLTWSWFLVVSINLYLLPQRWVVLSLLSETDPYLPRPWRPLSQHPPLNISPAPPPRAGPWRHRRSQWFPRRWRGRANSSSCNRGHQRRRWSSPGSSPCWTQVRRV